MARVLLAFEPPDGGVAENVRQLALGLAAHGWEPEVAGPPQATPYADLDAHGITIHRLPLSRGYGRPHVDARAVAALTALLRGGKFDLIHSHASKVGVLGRLAALASGTPSLYSPHCFAFTAELGWAWRVAAALIERTLGHAGGAILCVCRSERELALRYRVAPPERVHVVYNGCEPCPADVEPDPTLAALRARGPVIGALTVLREQKRLDVLIDAVPLILARIPDATVAIVGDGPLREQLERQRDRLGLDADGRFLLMPFDPPSARTLEALDLYVLPSAWEGFPIGILEALACGVPQVATDVGGNGEAITPDTGTLVPVGDPHALACAIAQLIRDPARRTAAADASRRRHAEHFTVERMVAETAALYDALTEAGATP